MKKGFTLAEILIVLTVIGVLTAILLPIAFNSAPDENVMKFKKANANLGRAIYELVNSDKYYQDGDLGVKPDGTLIDGYSDEDLIPYFCETLADILSVKSKNCSTSTSYFGYGYVTTIVSSSDTSDNTENAKANLDTYCAAMQSKIGEEIITSDGISWFQGSPYCTFGNQYGYIRRWFGGSFFQDSNGFDAAYKVLCIDIDGINTGEDPFGYGIRTDGKILPGKRADEWVEKSIQRGDD